MNPTTPENYAGYGRRCLMVFAVVMSITVMMVAVHYSADKLGHTAAIALTLVAAVVNAVLVAGYLMHLLSEKKVTVITLIFTAIFFAGLMLLILGAHASVPRGTVH